jgi:PAS domain S-box-containing protein
VGYLARIDYQRAFQVVPGLILLLRPDPDFTIIDASDAYLEATRTERENIAGRGFFEVFPEHPDAAHATAASNFRASLERVLVTRRIDTAVQQYDIRRRDSEGGGYQEKYWNSVNAPVLSEEGEVLCIVRRIEDVTELVRVSRREQEERAQLAEANNRFQAIYDQGLFAGTLDLDGRVIDANRSSLEQCGLLREDVVGKPFWECGWWNRSPDVQAWLESGVRCAIAGEPFRGESTYFWADGTERVVDFACMPIADEAGRILFVLATGMDITERVHREKNLRATDILESITEGFFALDRSWRFTFINREAGRLLGRAPQELLGTVIWDAFPALLGSEFERTYRRAMETRQAVAINAFYAEHDRWYDVHTYPTAEGLSIYFLDITGLKRAEAEQARVAAESERQRRVYEAALSSTPDLVYVFDLDHRFTYANEALLRIWGRGSKEALGKNCLELGYEPWHAAMHDREIDQVIATRQPIRGEVPFTGTAGTRMYEYIFVPVIGPDGDVVAVAGTTRDITDRQRAEQAIREQAARLSAADRAKDEFLATLAHELRNPLAPLRNSLSLLRMAGNGDPTAAPVHEMMERQVNHLVRLVDDLLEMSRISRGALTLRKERVEVAAVVRNALETSAPLINAAGHQLSVSLPEQTLWLEGDPVRLAQILANLLNNAAKYTETNGKISVKVEVEEGMVAISVLDNGAGIAADALPRIFDMFSRGDVAIGRDGGGLGIGLALARRLAEMHGGLLTARSEGEERGSEFIIRLPLAGTAKKQASAQELHDPAICRKRILLVDDNRDAADSLGMILEFLGADVRIARDGAEALDAVESYDPSVVLLDIGMPGMNGYDVARAIRTRFPRQRPTLVALTGWGQEDDRRRAREAGFDHHLIKPAEIGVLQALLASLHENDGRGGRTKPGAPGLTSERTA